MLVVGIVVCLGKNGYHALLAKLLPVMWVCTMEMLQHGGAVYSTRITSRRALGLNRWS